MRSLDDHAVGALEDGGQQVHLEDDVADSVNLDDVADIARVLDLSAHVTVSK